MPKSNLTTKDLALLSDLLTYEQWAAKKSKMYGEALTDPTMQGLCKTLEENHTQNFNDLYNFLKSY